MSSIILHISDLHVSLEDKLSGERVNKNSFLQIPKSKESSKHFIDKFIYDVKEECTNKKVYLLITGDISDCGAVLEFNYALEYLNCIITELKIERTNILLIPGDHDISRKNIEELKYSKENVTIEDINLVKYKNFSDFYFKLLNKEFDSSKVIFETLNFDNKIILLGINSNYYIDLEESLGKVDIEKFKIESAEIDNPLNLNFIACCHHNISSSYEDKNSGQWEKENRLRFLAILEERKIKYVFSGNEHTSSCKTIVGDLTISDSGSLSTIAPDSAYKIYQIVESEDIILRNLIFALQNTGSNDQSYFWDSRNNLKAKQTDQLIISVLKPQILEELVELPVEDTSSTNVKTLEQVVSTLKSEEDTIELQLEENTVTTEKELEIPLVYLQREKKVYYNSFYTETLYDKVKKLKLFHSGHFHWSETSRAHNWIDVSKLIENNENLNFVKNSIIDIIEDKNLHDADLIIGLGYEGNIISSKATIKYNKPYSFLPYSYRHDEHHEFENELNFNNDSGDFKKVLIITDVVNDGRTIRKLINKRDKQKAFFKNVEKVYVISLFYTGSSILNYDILNYDFVKTIPNYEIEGDEEVNNIEFYTVKSLKVEKCPYGKNFREECLIVKDNLGCVNLFYDESKYLQVKKTTI